MNPRPADYKSAALPTELHQHIIISCIGLHSPGLKRVCPADDLPRCLNRITQQNACVNTVFTTISWESAGFLRHESQSPCERKHAFSALNHRPLCTKHANGIISSITEMLHITVCFNICCASAKISAFCELSPKIYVFAKNHVSLSLLFTSWGSDCII